MASNPLVISWNNFTGGINDQKFQGQAGRYYLGYGVDTQRYDVRPTSSPNVIHTYPNSVTAIFNLEKVNGSTSNIVWSGSAIYYNSTLRHTLTQGIDGTQIGFMKPIGADFKLYYFHETVSTINPKYIHRSDIDGTNFEQSYRSYTMSTGNSYYTPPAGMIVISEGNRILFSNYNTIWEISDSEVVTKLIDLPENENVVGITEFQGQYKIYTTTAFSTSKMYTWDGGSDVPETSLNLNGIAIFSVVNNGAYDYVSADNNLYMFAGVQYQELYRDISNLIVLGNVDNYIYLEFSQGGKRVIGKYGNKPGYGNALTPLQIIEITSQTLETTAFDYNSIGILFASNKKLYKNTGTAETGTITPFIESLVFVGDSIAFLKELNEIRVKFSGFSTQNIIVSCQIQENGTWIKLFEGNNTTISSTNHGLKISKNKFLNPIGNFNTIRFRVEFPHTGTAQGKFYGIDVFGNQDIGV